MARESGVGAVNSGRKQVRDDIGSNANLQLERMGRELKCAICLSLFAQAATLSCNHTFCSCALCGCSACILQSLKRASCCPICKLPTARREVRPSPHMNILVDAYLHMENALGMTIFASRPTEVGCTRGKSRSKQGENTEAVFKSGLLRQRTGDKNLVHAKKRQKKLTSKSDFPTSMGPPEELSPDVRLAMEEVTLSLQSREATRNSNRVHRSGSPQLRPFFWIRDLANAEVEATDARPSPQSAHCAVLPAFSDLKGSDDEGFQSSGTKDDFLNAGHSHDDDICTWMQRPCCPEPECSLSKEPTASVAVPDCSVLLQETMSKVKTTASESVATRCTIGETGSQNAEASDLAAAVSTRQHMVSGGDDCRCAFCYLSGDSEEAGPMMVYKDGVLSLQVHRNCAEWAPRVFFEGPFIQNLGAEVARGQKIKCSSCKKKGAALGCCLARCRRSFHYPCARLLHCRWHFRKFMILCPEHAKRRFPGDTKKRTELPTAAYQLTKQATGLVNAGVQGGQAPAPANSSACQVPSKETQRWPRGPACKWVLCGSALNSTEKIQLAEFAALTGATLVNSWKSNATTHMIAGTDEQGAARRTLKYLMATLEGTWIVRVDWMLACKASGLVVNEEDYEIKKDIHGLLGGPKRGRTLAAAKGPKLFKGLTFYFFGQCAASYKADLQALALAGGGVVLQRKPLPAAQNPHEQIFPFDTLCNLTIVIYNDTSAGSCNKEWNVQDLSREATGLASSLGAVALSQSWLLDSSAACKLQGDVAALMSSS